MDELGSTRVEIRLASRHRSFIDRLLIEKLWDRLDYRLRHRLLSAVERRIDIHYDGEKLFSVTVPEAVFNPYRSSAPTKVIELILSEAFPVAGKRVVDLGCGSGVVGLTAIHKGATAVLFSDINPYVAALKDNPDLRSQDDFVIQNGLERTALERPAAFDLVIALLPLMVTEEKVVATSFEVGVKRPPNLLTTFLQQSHVVLDEGGQVLFYTSIPPSDGAAAFDDFVFALCERLGFGACRILAHQHLPRMGGDHVIFTATKRS